MNDGRTAIQSIGDLDATFRRHGPTILRYATRRVGPHEAPDVVSETFLTAWRRREETDTAAIGWLYRTAQHVIANHRRSAVRRLRLVDELGSWISPEVVDGFGDRTEAIRALAALSEDDRDLLIAVGWDGLSTADAAVAFDVSPEALRVRLHRARGRLDAAFDRAHRDEFATAPISKLTGEKGRSHG